MKARRSLAAARCASPPATCLRHQASPARLRFCVCAVLAALAYLSGLPLLTPTRAAADAPIQQRLGEAVRLPAQDLEVKWGLAGAQDWLSEPPVVDPPAARERLRARLKGEPSDAPVHSEIARVTRLLEDPEAAATAAKEAYDAWQRWAEAAPDNREALKSHSKDAGLRLAHVA